MSMVPSLPSDTPPASGWRGPRVKGAVASNGPGGAASRLTESLESPFATLLEAVGIGSEVGPAKVAVNERTGTDDGDELPEEREDKSEEKRRKRAEDAATEVAGMLVAAGAQSGQRVSEPLPIEAGRSSSVGSDAPVPTGSRLSDGELTNLGVPRDQDEGSLLPATPLAGASEMLDEVVDAADSSVSAQLPEVFSTPQSGFLDVLQSTGGQIPVEGSQLIVNTSQPITESAERSSQTSSSEAAGEIVLPPFSETQTDASGASVPMESAMGRAAAEQESSEEYARNFEEKSGSQTAPGAEATLGSLGDLPIEAPATQTARPQVAASPAISSPLAGMITGEVGAPNGSTSGGAVRVSGQVAGVASAAGISPGGAGGAAQLQVGGDASPESEVDQLALHLLGLEGSGATGGRVAGFEGSLGMARDGIIDRSHLLRALGRIEKTLKGLAETKEAKTVSLRLDPPSLGSMTVDVSFRDGELHARLTPELPQVAAILRERSHELHAALRKIGLSVDQVRVSIDTGAGGAGAGDGGARHGSSRHDGGARDFADQVAPVAENGLRQGDRSNGIGGAWRDGRWIA